MFDFLTLKSAKAREENIQQPGYLAPKQTDQAEKVTQQSTLQVARRGSCEDHLCLLFVFFSLPVLAEFPRN